MPENIQGSGLYHDQFVAMVDDSQRLWIHETGSVNIFGNINTIQKNTSLNGSIWVDSSGALLNGPRSGLILQNLGPGDVCFNFGSPFTGSMYGFTLRDYDIYEMSDYFLFTGSITLAKIGTGSSNISYIQI